MNTNETTVLAEPLDAAIREVLARPEFAWRLPREETPTPEGEGGLLAGFLKQAAGWIRNAFRFLWEWLEKLWDWLIEHLGMDEPMPDDGYWQIEPQLLLLALLAVTASVLAIALLRLIRRRRAVATAAAAAVPAAQAPDITRENVDAAQLPSDQWMRMAREFLVQGETRLAVRAMFLAVLAHLAANERLTIAAHKSNREYVAELRRRARDDPSLLAAFSQNTALFERAWYGMHPLTDDLLAGFTVNQETLLHGASSP